MAGTHTMWSAFGESVNTYFVQLQEMVTVKSVMAEKLGIPLQVPRTFDIANAEAAERCRRLVHARHRAGSPLDMANAYATIAARGKRCDPLPILKLLDRNGKPIPAPAAPRCRQVIPPTSPTPRRMPPAAPSVTRRCPAARSRTARRLAASAKPSHRPVAGKTGTTDENNARRGRFTRTPRRSSSPTPTFHWRRAEL